MYGTQFGYCGFVPHTPTELAFARAEENDARGCRVKGRVNVCCWEDPVAKDQTEPMNEEGDRQRHDDSNDKQAESLIDGRLAGMFERNC